MKMLFSQGQNTRIMTVTLSKFVKKSFLIWGKKEFEEKQKYMEAIFLLILHKHLPTFPIHKKEGHIVHLYFKRKEKKRKKSRTLLCNERFSLFGATNFPQK